jgi:parallel beta-helix repeat protein
MKSILASLSLLFIFPSLHAGSIDLKAGMVITSSAIVNRSTYYLNAGISIAQPVIIIDGKDITLDFNQSVLQGSNDKTDPDKFYGLAVQIKKGSKNITIKNASIHGFKLAIMADDVLNLTIENCDLSYNWRQHLQSTRDKENLDDWMSFHNNENDEWLRYGAGIYLKNCKKANILNNTITGGQCALMMSKCTQAEVHDNNFSFNSGIGIGMYRSSNNRIYYNRLDYNVRGYSFGKYKRGQDSAGILVFEQSSDNVFAYNTATHSGDGFFLWAGQTTMDTGKGGCNDNFVYGNDFSYAPTNGIEVTFSRNLLMKNILKSCDHGIWGGYSYDSDITDNLFENNRIAIAIEHGQNINIALNHFTGDSTGIKLWSREKQPDDWAYPKLKNTESKNYWIAANNFMLNNTIYNIMGTDTVVLSGNKKSGFQFDLQLGERSDNIDTSRENDPFEIEYQKDPRLASFKTDHAPEIMIPQGKDQIRMMEWGPYDFRYPLLWLKEIDSIGLYHFDIQGPKGNWELQLVKGFDIVYKGEAGFPSSITAKKDGTTTNGIIQLKYNGPSFVNAFGKLQDSSSHHFFEYRTP